MCLGVNDFEPTEHVKGANPRLSDVLILDHLHALALSFDSHFALFEHGIVFGFHMFGAPVVGSTILAALDVDDWTSHTLWDASPN
jgi:hypothetical protein